MPKILGSDKTGVTRRVNETESFYILDGTAYDKTTMNPILFHNFSDLGEPTTLGTYKSLNPYSQKQFWNGRVENSFIQDNLNENITWEVVLRYPTGGSASVYSATSWIGLNQIDKRNNTIKRSFFTIDKFYSSYYFKVCGAVKILGQSNDYIYISVARGQSSSSNINSYLYSAYIYNTIYAISKNNLQDEQTYSISDSLIFKQIYQGTQYTFNAPLLIKETTERMYFINNYSHYSSDYQFEIFYIDKTNNSYTQIKYFSVNNLAPLGEEFKYYSNYNYGNGVQMTKAFQKEDNSIEVYGVTFAYNNAGTTDILNFKNIFNKIIIKLDESEVSRTVVEMKNITADIEPFFASNYAEKLLKGNSLVTIDGSYSSVANERLDILEHNGTRFLLTMNNVYYSEGNTSETWKFDVNTQNDKNIIALYKLNESSDNITAQLVRGIKLSELEPEFYGGLINEEFKTILAIGKNNLYMIEINLEGEDLTVYKNNEITGRAIGIDKNGNSFVSTSDDSIYVLSRTKSTYVTATIKDLDNLPKVEEGKPVEVTILIDSYNFKNEKVETPLILKIGGVDDVVFKENEQPVIKKTTSSVASTEVVVVCKYSGLYKFYIDVELPL